MGGWWGIILLKNKRVGGLVFIKKREGGGFQGE